MLNLNFFSDFDDLDELVDVISACCKSGNVDPMSYEGRMLINNVVNKRRFATLAHSVNDQARLGARQTAHNRLPHR